MQVLDYLHGNFCRGGYANAPCVSSEYGRIQYISQEAVFPEREVANTQSCNGHRYHALMVSPDHFLIHRFIEPEQLDWCVLASY